ncbi:MAG: ABC transporter ATP-binding protein [Myxococcales bacterium]|nr:ABC transporter ATP-binding protein [Myxococcales bacterium]
MITIRGLTKVYNPRRPSERVLSDLDLVIPEREVVSIVGTSGSGKSTLLNIIGGLDRHYDGSVSIDGRDIQQMNDTEISQFRNSKIGFVFQDFNLLPHLTCGENIALPAYFRQGLTRSEIDARVRDVLSRVTIPHKLDQYPDLLSGGERQRVAIARALFNHPKILLCDEPTGSLDSKSSQLILDLFLSLNENEGLTIVLVTHDASVSRRADRIVRLEDGRVVTIEANQRQPVGAPTREPSGAPPAEVADAAAGENDAAA